MLMRANNVWINTDELRERETGYTYVMPKNVLRRFVGIADLKVRVFGYLYGVTVEGMVREIRCVVVVPQVGSRDGVTIPGQMPESEFLKGLEPMGWIQTCPDDKNFLNVNDAAMHAKFIS